MEKVFVYGTLKEGYGNNRLLAGAKFLGNHTVKRGRFCLLNLGWFPGVVMRERYGLSTPVTGEVYEVDDGTFKALDGLEGYPTMYDRIEIETKYGDAWMYVYNDHRESINASHVCKEGVWPNDAAE